MGKGLGISQSGTHAAFLAGTGVLIFIDLVAYLIRYNLNLLNRNDRELISESNFRFILHVSFPRKEEAVAIEMLEALQSVTQKKGLNNFELMVRYSNQNKGRWDEDFVERQLEVLSKVDLKKIWVCGPPVMNEVFDKTFERFSART